jgi:hypothetical protein
MILFFVCSVEPDCCHLPLFFRICDADGHFDPPSKRIGGRRGRRRQEPDNSDVKPKSAALPAKIEAEQSAAK